MVGLALVMPDAPEGEQAPQAYGHAWTEIHDGETWRVADATKIDDEPGVTTRLLPLQLVDNEGPGYALPVMAVVQVLPKRIEIRAAE